MQQTTYFKNVKWHWIEYSWKYPGRHITVKKDLEISGELSKAEENSEETIFKIMLSDRK